MIRIPEDFDWQIYLKINPDLTIKTPLFAINHYLEYGNSEKRRYSELPYDFNWQVYLKINPDLTIKTPDFARRHYLEYGIREKRSYLERIKFKPSYTMSFLEHRGGWRTVLENLIERDFYDESSPFDFFDMLETKFLWNREFVCDNKWAGIIHCTPNTPEYLNNNNIQYFFQNSNFIKSLENCVFLITLSEYITDYLKDKLNSLNIHIPVHTLTYPVDQKDIIYFSYADYINNENKKIIQIGQQLRKVTSIFLLDLQNLPYQKLWFTGTKKFETCEYLLEKEIEYLHIPSFQKNVDMIYTETFYEYDSYLSKNIVFIDLFDAAANTTIVECIIRNTPILVNKVGGVEKYLGSQYPLYFNELKDIPALLTNEKIKDAHEYLSNRNKEKLKMGVFLEDLFKIIRESF